MVAVDAGDGSVWYGQLLLCFIASYLGAKIELVYLRWLDTTAMVAAHHQRPVSPDEVLGPFETFRWAVFAGPQWVRDGHPPRWRQYRGHPAAGKPHYGVVRADQIRYRAPMLVTLHEKPSAPDPLFRLNSDMLCAFA